MTRTAVTIGPRPLAWADLRAALRGPVSATLDAQARAAIARGAQAVSDLLAEGAPIYGVNTGFGKLASQRIAPEELSHLQRNLVRSHASGTDEPLPAGDTRLAMLLKIKSLAAGHSGVRPELVEALIALLHADILPVIPRQGSVGASGDLAPLAHLSLVVIGEGEALHEGVRISGAEALERAGVRPVELAPKEGLALLNGTQVSTALALSGLAEAERAMRAGLVAGAMSVDAIMGSDTPFDPRLHELRPHAGQKLVAAELRRLIAGSGIRASHLECDRVQDPYSFRCQPQVLGAARDLLVQSGRTLLTEANAVTDNPLVFPEDGDVLSGGNFHAEPVAFASDIVALAISETGALAERRVAALIDPGISYLPAFLTSDAGLNSGYMIPQVTAAALAAENKHLAHPASIDSLPTSANQEDHVSMATHAGWRLKQLNANVRRIVAIELMAAAEGIEFRRPLRSSAPVEEAHALIRAEVPKREADRTFGAEIETVAGLIADGAFDGLVGDLLADGL